MFWVRTPCSVRTIASVCKETWLGVGVSHRSGAFGRSQLYGNVNGGSNYIYVSAETTF